MRKLVLLIVATAAGCADPTRPREDATSSLFVAAGDADRREVCPGDDDAYATIAAALAAVPAGGTVEVCPGEYAESLLIDKGVTIEGSGRGTVTLAPPVSTPDAVIRVLTSDPVVIENIVIDYAGRFGIFARDRVDLTIDRVSVLADQPLQASNDALASGGRAALVVRNSSFDGRGRGGVFVVGDVDAVIERNLVRRTGFSCIQVQSGGFDVGATATPSADIVENVVDECGIGGGIRLRVGAGSVVNVVRNTARNTTGSNSPFGILFGGFPNEPGVATGRVEGNRIIDYVQSDASSTMAAGIGVLHPAQPVVRFNDIAGNAHAGLRVTGATTIDARCNWWGAANGPSGLGPGSGDAVVGSSTFVPFAVAPVTDQAPDRDRKACQRQTADIE